MYCLSRSASLRSYSLLFLLVQLTTSFPTHPSPEHGASPYGADQYGADEHGASQYGADQYGADKHGASQYGADQYGADEHGASQYGGSKYGGSKYGGEEHGESEYESNDYRKPIYEVDVYAAPAHGAAETAVEQYGDAKYTTSDCSTSTTTPVYSAVEEATTEYSASTSEYSASTAEYTSSEASMTEYSASETSASQYYLPSSSEYPISETPLPEDSASEISASEYYIPSSSEYPISETAFPADYSSETSATETSAAASVTPVEPIPDNSSGEYQDQGKEDNGDKNSTEPYVPAENPADGYVPAEGGSNEPAPGEGGADQYSPADKPADGYKPDGQYTPSAEYPPAGEDYSGSDNSTLAGITPDDSLPEESQPSEYVQPETPCGSCLVSTDVHVIANRWLSSFSTGGLWELGQAATEDVQYWNEEFTYPGCPTPYASGRSQLESIIRDSAEKWGACSDISFEVVSAWNSCDRIALRWKQHGTATGKDEHATAEAGTQVTFSGIDLLTIDLSTKMVRVAETSADRINYYNGLGMDPFKHD